MVLHSVFLGSFCLFLFWPRNRSFLKNWLISWYYFKCIIILNYNTWFTYESHLLVEANFLFLEGGWEGGRLARPCAAVWGGLGWARSSWPTACRDQSREAAALVRLESQLKKVVSKYKYRDLTVHETVNLITWYKDLKSVLDSYVFNDGISRELINVSGIIPVPYTGIHTIQIFQYKYWNTYKYFSLPVAAGHISV